MKTVKVENVMFCETGSCKFNDLAESNPRCTKTSIELLDYKDKQICATYIKK
jgi:hypothetical protein